MAAQWFRRIEIVGGPHHGKILCWEDRPPPVIQLVNPFKSLDDGKVFQFLPMLEHASYGLSFYEQTEFDGSTQTYIYCYKPEISADPRK